MTEENLAELARLAEAATPGPWKSHDEFVNAEKHFICEINNLAKPEQTAAYIAAANPEAVLGLIARIDELSARCAKLEAALQFYADIGTYGTAGPGDCTSVDSSDCEPVLIDGWGESYRPGKRAREALKEET